MLLINRMAMSYCWLKNIQNMHDRKPTPSDCVAIDRHTSSVMLQLHNPLQNSACTNCFTNHFLHSAQLSDSAAAAAAFCFRKLSLDVHSESPLARKSNNTENFSFIAWLLLLQGRILSTLPETFQS